MPSSSVLQVKWSDQGTTRVLLATGELDVASVRRLHEAVDRALSDRPETVVLDLSALSFCDSSAIRLAEAAHRRAAVQSVRFVVVRPKGPALLPRQARRAASRRASLRRTAARPGSACRLRSWWGSAATS
jgi:anti-anti-sigma factor